MKHKILLMLLTFLSVVAYAQAQEYFNSGEFEYRVISEEEKTCEISDYFGKDSKLEIPSIITRENDSFTIVGIGNGVFRESKDITVITLPETITTIGDYCFYRSSLSEINIPESVSEIGSYAFTRTLISSPTLPRSLTILGEYAFMGCNSIFNITIPESLINLPVGVFEECLALSSVTLPNTIEKIGAAAFYGCTNLRSINIPESVKIIGYNAFENVSSKIKVNFASIESVCSIIFMGRNANPAYRSPNLFINGQLVQDLVIPETVTSIGDFTFYGCSNLTSVTLPETVTSIGSFTFYGCTGLTSVSLPEPLTSIGQSAFDNCKGLTSITLSKSLTNIGSGAFQNCDQLRSIIIPNEVTKLGTEIFRGCYKLKSIIIPDNIKSIGDRAFYDCSRLSDITIPEELKEIGQSAFENCSSLTQIIIPIGLEKLGDSAFKNCSAVTKVFYGGDNLSQLGRSGDIFSGIYDTAILYVKESEVDFVQFYLPWSEFKNVEFLPSLKISKEELNIGIGEIKELNVTVSPEEKMPFGRVSAEWKSSDTSIATVKGDGFTAIINALKEGEAIIYCILKWGDVWKQTLKCNVNVKKIQLVESLTLNPAANEVEEGWSFQITATVLPEDATDKTLEWSSSDESVAMVDETGLVSVLKVGECVITAKTTDGSDLTANCYLSATTGISKVSFDTDETVDVYSLDGVKVRT
ncbi:MAG: leucine-rich repeat protein, partial [Muribaculaceae bacterium]|nr:leucine-rich repeat protein [Muribaculaceae bacterium]